VFALPDERITCDDIMNGDISGHVCFLLVHNALSSLSGPKRQEVSEEEKITHLRASRLVRLTKYCSVDHIKECKLDGEFCKHVEEEQDRQCTYDVILRRVRVTVDAVEKQ